MQKGNMKQRGLAVVIAVMSLGLLWSLAIPAVARAQAPDAVCVLQLLAEGAVFGILVDAPQNFNLAVALPQDKNINVPIPCNRLSSLGLGVSNQKNNNVNILAQVYTHDGELVCSKGPYLVPVNGAVGVTFPDCTP